MIPAASWSMQYLLTVFGSYYSRFRVLLGDRRAVVGFTAVTPRRPRCTSVLYWLEYLQAILSQQNADLPMEI